MTIFGIVCVIAILVALLIAYQGGFAVPAVIRGVIAALVIILVAWLLVMVIGGGAPTLR